MPDSNQTNRVFLDTEIFDHHQYDFQSPNIRRFARLAAAGVLQVYSTLITDKEIRRHLDEKVGEIMKSVKNYKRIGRIVGKYIPQDAIKALEAVDEETVRTGLYADYDSFLLETGTQQIPLSVDLDELFDKYNKQEAPFGPHGKQKEFPDAVAISTLVNGCESFKTKMYAVGGDSDWRKSCQAEPLLLYVRDLPGLLEIFADSVLVTTIKAALEDELHDLIATMKALANDFDVCVDDSVPDGEINHFECSDVSIPVMHVVEAKDGIAIIACYSELLFKLDAVADDPDSAIYDSEDKRMHYVYRMSGKIEREVEREATIKVQYDQAKPDDIEVLGVTFDDPELLIAIDEGELQREEDWEDPDVEPEGP